MALGFRVGQHVLALNRLDRNPKAMASFADAKALEATDVRLQKCWKAVAKSWRRYELHSRQYRERRGGKGPLRPLTYEHINKGLGVGDGIITRSTGEDR